MHKKRKELKFLGYKKLTSKSSQFSRGRQILKPLLTKVKCTMGYGIKSVKIIIETQGKECAIL